MGMNPALKPFADKRVRQAINHAIDTDLIIKRLVKDKAYRATSWLPLTSPLYDKTMKPYAFDPEKAKKLLADAGYPNGFEFEWTTSQNESWGLPIVEAVIPMLDKVGIKVKVKQIETAVLTETVRKGEFQAYIWSSDTGPDPQAALKCFHSKTPRQRLQLRQLQERRVRQADRRGRPDRRQRQARAAAAEGQCHPLRGSAGVVLQLQQGGDGLAAVAQGLAAQCDRADAPVCRGSLGRRSIAGEMSARRQTELADSVVSEVSDPRVGHRP